MDIRDSSLNNSCFICDQYADPNNGNGVFAINTFSKKSGKDYYSLLQNIIGDHYKLTFVESDVICHTCSLLIEELDSLQTEAIAISIMLNRQVYRKYNIVDEFKLGEQGVCDNTIIYSPQPDRDEYKYSNLICKECNIIFNDNYLLKIHNNELHIGDPIVNQSETFSDENRFFECIYQNFNNTKHSHNNIIEFKDKSTSFSYILENPMCNKTDCNDIPELLDDTVSKVDSGIEEKKKSEIHLSEIKRRCKKTFFKHKVNSEMLLADLIRCIHCDAELQRNETICSHDDAINNGLKTTACNLCNAVFYKNNLKQTHLRKFHFSCTQCNNQFETYKSLTKHENNHKSKAKHKCSWCLKVFNTRYGLIYHIPKHTGEYKYYCKICNRGFMHSKFLEEHMGVHTKADKYICDICGRKFSFNATYRLHRLWHDNPYPYECKDCGKKFKHTSVLAVHRKTVHTGERPHNCNVCNKAFVASSTLKRHMMIHTGDYRYKCTICDKGFTAKQKYGKHMAKVHNDYTFENNKNICEYRMAIPPSANDKNDNNVSDVVNNKMNDYKQDTNRKYDEIILNFDK